MDYLSRPVPPPPPDDFLRIICKSEHICHVLCAWIFGWGGFAKYAAEKYGAKLHGITVSREQVDFGNNCCRCLDVKIELKDYRKVREKFDRIVSIGMFEHVGGTRTTGLS